MSPGATICIFLTCSGRPVPAAASSRSVCRQRKAGICSDVRHLGHRPALPSLVDIRDDRDAEMRLHFGQHPSPRLRPGPRGLSRELRLALSKEALKMKGSRTPRVSSTKAAATSSTMPGPPGR